MKRCNPIAENEEPVMKRVFFVCFSLFCAEESNFLDAFSIRERLVGEVSASGVSWEKL